MDRLLKNLQPERVVFSALGLREGWLYSQLTPEEQRLDPLIEGAQAFGLPAARVPDFAPALVRWTDQLFPDETEEERRLRVAACALSDIAWADHADVKAQECFRRIVHFPFIGLTHPERVFIGATLHARHAGKPDDPAIQKALTLITPSIHRRAQIERNAPANPARPLPSPNVSILTRSVLTPMQAAMSRFCMTARMSRPSGVLVSSSQTSTHDRYRKSDHEKPVPSQQHVAHCKVSA